MARRKYRRNYQIGGFLKSLANKVDGGLYDKYGRKRKWNTSKSGGGSRYKRNDRPLYQPLTLNEKQKYYNEVKNKMNRSYMWKNVNKALGGSPRQQINNNLKKFNNTFLYKNVSKNIKQKGGNKRKKRYKKGYHY